MAIMLVWCRYPQILSLVLVRVVVFVLCEHCRVCTCTVLCDPALKYVHQIYEVNWAPYIRKEELSTNLTVFSSLINKLSQ